MKPQKIVHNIQRKTLIIFCFVLLVIAAVCGLFYYRTTQFIADNQWVQHTNQVLHKTEEAISALKDVETYQRNYLVSGDEKFLASYQQALIETEKNFQDVRRLTADNLGQQQRLDFLEPLLKAKLKLLAETVRLRGEGRVVEAQKLVSERQNLSSAEVVSRTTVEIKAEEERLLKIRTVAAEESERSTIQTLITISFLMVFFLTIAYWQVRRDIAERKRAEDSLERERDFISKVVDNSRALALVLDKEGRIIRFNRTCEETSGFLFEDICNKPFWEVLLPPEDRARIAIVYKSLKPDDYPTTHENYWLTRKGTRRLIAWSNSALLNKDGEVEFTIGTGIDVTESREAQQIISESESRYRLMFDSNPHPTWVHELGTFNILAVNDAAVSVYGYSKDEFLRMNLNDLRSPANVTDFLKEVEKASAGVNQTHPSRHLKKDGNQIEVEINAHSLIYEGKQARLVVATDVTERKKAEKLLFERERLAVLNSEISLALIENKSLPEILDSCARSLVKHLEGAFVRIWTLEKEANVLELQASAGLYTHLDGAHSRVPVGKFKIGLIAEERKPHLTNSVLKDARIGDPEWARREEMVAFAGYPLLAGEKLIGVVAMFARHSLNSTVLDAMAAAANIISLGIERSRAEKSLQQNLSLLGSTLEATDNAIVAMTLQGEINAYNQKYLKMWNLTEEAIERAGNVRELYSYLEALKEPEEYIRKSNEFIRLQPELSNYQVLEFKDGRIFERFSHPQIQNGKVVGRVLSFRDITAQKESERALRDSELRNRNLIDRSLGLISTHDMNGVLLSVNPAAARALEYEPHEFIGKSLKELLAPAVKHLFEFYLEQMREKGEHSGLMALLTKSGAERTFAYRNTVYQEDGKPPFVLGHAQDITEMRRAEAEKRIAQRRLQFHLENSGIALIEWSRDWRILNWSPAAEKIFGWRADEVIGKKTPEELKFVYEEDAAAVNAILADLSIGKGMATPIVNRNYTKDEAVVTCEWFSSAQFDHNGEIVSFLTLARDITERQQMEAELFKAHDAALESARMKSEFLANMSHEIRTPMNGVIGMTDLLFTTELDTEQREYAETIKTSAGALLTVINDILDFSKIEAGKLHFETIDFDLRNTVESVVELFAEPAQSKKLELASLVEANVPVALRGDPGRLRQVLTNLIGNAVKFTDTGEVVVQVSLERESKEEAHLCFSIKDTGIGIDKEVQGNLFQAFVQADGSTTRKYGGTGLGLAISKQLVEMMDGSIKIESELNEGSTFSFTARFVKQPVVKQKKKTPRADLKNLRVLIVDDNETNRKILKHQVKAWGMFAVKARDGADALEKLRTAALAGNPFDLAILDLMMPAMNGFELATLIKSDPLISAVKLIIMPSFGTRGHGLTAKEAGISGYLIKPVRQSDLFDCITAVMEQVEENTAKRDEMIELVTRHTLDEKRYQAQTQDLILVAEDNPVNQKVIKVQLEKLGYQADVVANGLEAVNAWQKRAYSLVLMDCQMPEMDGYAATKEIRRREKGNSHTPVIAVTANAMQGEREKCLAAGMDDYISKPLKMNLLKEIVERWLEVGTANAVQNADSNVGGNSSNDNSLVDMEVLRDITGNNPEMLNQIVSLYIEQTDEMIMSMSAALERQDAAEVYRLAHKSFGSSATCGMQTMSAPLREMEKMGREGELALAAPKLSEIKEEYDKLRVYLGNMLLPEVLTS